MNDFRKLASRLFGEGSASSIVAGLSAAPIEDAADVVSVKSGDKLRIKVLIKKVSAFHGISFDLVLPSGVSLDTDESGAIKKDLGDAFEDVEESSVDKSVNAYPERTFVSLSLRQGSPAISAAEKALIVLYATIGESAPASDGLVEMRNVKALKWDDSEIGFSEIATRTIPLSIVYESAPESSEILLKIVVEKL